MHATHLHAAWHVLPPVPQSTLAHRACDPMLRRKQMPKFRVLLQH